MTSDRKSQSNQWTKLSDRLLQKTRVFDLHAQLMRSPDGSYEDDFYYIKSADWVNVLPVTPDGKLIMVKQFRHGISQPSLETPGGIIDSESEGPLKTAVRELAEETGYVAEEMIPLGTIHPNPAMLTNRCHIFLATNVTLKHNQNLDPAEDITVHLFPLRDLPAMIQKGEVSHAIVAAALFLLWAEKPELLKS